MRNLASIVTIEKIWPLEGKDRVVGASFVENGYEAMVGKDIQPEQTVAFIQEGALLPVCDTWEWLRKRCYKESVNAFLIKPQKFGCIKSWGLVVPLPELGLPEKVYSKFKAGDDITDLLGIKKYEPEEDASPIKSDNTKYPKWVKFCLSHTITRWLGRIWQKKHQSHSGGFPTDLITKSDETAIQNMKSALEKYADDYVYVTAKMEGQSFTTAFEWDGKKPGKFYVCSRNNAYKCPDNSIFWTVAKRLDIEKKLRDWYKEKGQLLVIQGEQVGPSIQENIYDFAENEWYVFKIRDIIEDRQLSIEEMIDVCGELGLKRVPLIIKHRKLREIMPDLDAAVAYAENVFWTPDNLLYTPKDGEKLWVDYFQHEGVVVRSVTYDKENNIGVSFKVKNIAYAEKGLDKIHQACVARKNRK